MFDPHPPLAHIRLPSTNMPPMPLHTKIRRMSAVQITVDHTGRLIVALPPEADIRLDIKRVAGQWIIGKNSRIGAARLDVTVVDNTTYPMCGPHTPDDA